MPETEIELYRNNTLAATNTIIAQNRVSASSAKNATEQMLSQWDGLNLTELDLQAGETLANNLTALRGKLKLTFETLQGRRKPITQIFDQVRSEFTGEENVINESDKRAKAKLDAWETEKKRRRDAEKIKLDNKIKADTEVIEIKKHISLHAARFIQQQITEGVAGVSKAFYSKNADEVANYSKLLVDWSAALEGVPFDEDALRASIPTYFARYGADQIELKEALLPEIFQTGKAQFIREIKSHVDKLHLTVGARITELKADAAKAEQRAAQAQLDEAEQQRQNLQNTESAIVATADNEASDAVFAAGSEAQQMATRGAGVTEKTKYKPVTHGHYNTLMRWYVSHIMPSLKIEEVESKFKFMLTAANKALSEGVETIEGIPLIEEVSSSARRGRKPNPVKEPDA